MPINLRRRVVSLLAHGMHWSGALRLVQSVSQKIEIAVPSEGRRSLRKAHGPKFVILCYHRVGMGGIPYYSQMDPRLFEAQMAFLRRAYRIVTLDQLCRELDEPDARDASCKHAVAITFDDGYGDLYDYALPILRKYNLPATVYLTASAIETGKVSWYDRIFALVMASQSDTLEFEGLAPGRFVLSSKSSRLQAATQLIKVLRRNYTNQERVIACEALERKMESPPAVMKNRMLTWGQIREMQQAGLAFGAHTMSHPAVSRLAPGEREHELVDSRKLLEERLQRPVTHFAYPFGSVSDIDPETCSLIPQYGYRSAASTVWGLNTPNTHRYLLRRIGAEELTVSHLAFHLRWLFLKENPTPPELLALEEASEDRITLGKNLGSGQTACEARIGHA